MENKAAVKPWYTSKTIWFNLGIGVLGVLEASTGVLKPLLGEYYGFTMMAIAMAGVLLRTVSTATLSRNNDAVK